jgi:hypothetical protein
VKRRLAFNFEFAALLLVLGIINFPLLAGQIQPYRDTFTAPFQEFSIVYDEVRFHNQLPLWLPTSSYGIPDYFAVLSLSAVNFCFIGIGKLFHIANTFTLFKWSLFFEQAIALAGMYLLGYQLFKKRTSVWLVCLAFLATFLVYKQVQINFRLVYLLPWILYWIVRYFNSEKAQFLWIAGLTTLLSIPGSAIYPLILEFYAIGIFFIVMLAGDYRKIRGVFKLSRASLIWLAALILASAVSLYYFRYFNDWVAVFREGRSADLSVTLSDYLGFGEWWGPLEIAASFLYGIITATNTSWYEYVFYIGLLPLAAAVGALLYQRRLAWLSTLVSMIFLFWAAMRGPFSSPLYYLPFVNLIRYTAVIAMVPFRVFLILAAGFGFDLDWKPMRMKNVALLLVGAAVLVEVLSLVALSLDPLGDIVSKSFNYIIYYRLALIRGIVYALAFLGISLSRQFPGIPNLKPFKQPDLARIILITALFIDLVLYRTVYEKINLQHQVSFPDQANGEFIAKSPEYQPQRLREPEKIAVEQRYMDAIGMSSVNPYMAEALVHFDRCLPFYVNDQNRFEFITAGIQPLLAANLTLVDQPDSISLNQVYACQNPKLRVVSNVLVAKNDLDAVAEIAKREQLGNLLVLSRAYSDQKTSLDNEPVKASFEVTEFNANQLKATVHLENAASGWLVYSDAYHPSWRAFVNNQEVKIERAYLGFKAIYLESQTNQVEFRYGTWSFKTAYSLLALLLGMAGLAGVGVVFGLLFFPAWRSPQFSDWCQVKTVL